MSISGTDFEKLVKPFFEELFSDMGFFVIKVRQQNSGTQNGFDIKVIFEDDGGVERGMYVECKYYKTELDFSKIVSKIGELSASSYQPDALIALSPIVNISNKNDNVLAGLQKVTKFPCTFWEPDTNVENMFALAPDLYQKVYDKECTITVDKDAELEKLKRKIEILLERKDLLGVTSDIEEILIEETKDKPNEEPDLRTNLDKKLDELFKPEDERRLRYHQYRCDYKIFLEGLQDLNNELRKKIMLWQDNLRQKAYRLTDKFDLDEDYTSIQFFHDFFDIADKELAKFYDQKGLSGSEERLLNGVVFELAAECPLNWGGTNV